MPGAAVDIGTGTTITFGTTGYSAQIDETIDWSDVTRGAVRTTHMGSTQPSVGQFGGHTYIPTKFANPGTLNLLVHFNPNDNVPIHQPPEMITATFPLVSGDMTAAYWYGTGFIIAASPSIPLEDKMVQRLTLQMSGNITMVEAT